MDRRTFICSAAVAIVAAQASPTLAEVPKHFVGSVEKRVDLPTWQIRSWGNRTYEFSPKSTALIVIDMQKDFFVGEDGRYVPELAAIVPRVSRLVKTLRARGCRVFHTREGYAPDLSDVSPYKQSLDYVGRQGSLGRYLIRGEAGHDFLDELRPSSQNTIIEKAGFSAFYGTTLHQQLRREGITDLILCGVTTECCVQSTLRDAVDHGYWCLTVADCCATFEKDLHTATIRLIGGDRTLFGWICGSSAVKNAKQLRQSEIPIAQPHLP